MLGVWDLLKETIGLLPQGLGLTRGADIAFYTVTSIGPLLCPNRLT